MATLAYYDVFDFPLKAGEVFYRLVSFVHLEDAGSAAYSRHDDFGKLGHELDQLVLDGAVSRSGDFYFLNDREYLIPLRLKREKLAERKWRKALRAIRWLALAPYIRAVFASGSLAAANPDELSDLDVLIVVKHGRIWLSRLFISAILSLIRMRRGGRDIIAPDKICPNHYVTDQSLKINLPSLYNAQTYANLKPIWVRDLQIAQNFKEQNGWALNYVSHWNWSNRPRLKSAPSSFMRGMGEFLLNNFWGDWLEGVARRYQSARISSGRQSNEPGGRVVYNDSQLEFHPRSIEAEVIAGYNQRLVDLGLGRFARERDSGLFTK